MKLLMILAILFISLIIIVPLVERFTKPVSEEKHAQLSKILFFCVGLMMMVSTIMFFME